MRPALAALLAVATVAPAARAHAHAMSADSATTGFVVLAGTDTIALERVTRTATHLRGELLVRAQGIIQRYELTLGPAATVPRIEVTAFRVGAPPDYVPLQHAVVALDSTGATVTGSGGPQHLDTPAGSLPFINLSGGVLDQLFRRARAIGGDAPQLPVLVLAGGRSVPATVRWVGADSAVLTLGVELRARVGPDGELLGAEVPAQHVRFVRTAPPSLDAAPPDYSAPPGAPYTAENVTVPNAAAGVRLAGTLTVPIHDRGTRVPAVVLITGSGAQDRDEASPALPDWRPFREIADTLGRRGIAVLRLDDRGVGGSQAGPPGATSADLAGDVRAALAWLRTRPDVDPARLALLGHSEGGMIAPMVAADDSALRAVVLVAGPARTGLRISDMQVAQSFDEQGITGARRDSLLRINTRARDSAAAHDPWTRFWLDYDPLPAARRVRQPVLVVQGATDRQVSADQAEELAAAIRAGGNRDVTVHVVPDMNHLLVHDPSGAYSGYAMLPSYAVKPELLGSVADWLVARLVP
jgi:alpha-beta hydrolase superfamily lysophospholipase